MKTPREILLARHRAVEPKLEALSRVMVTRLAKPRSHAALRLPGFLHTFWEEVVRPARPLWTGLAAAWVLILAAQLSFHAGAPRKTPAISPNAAAYFLTLREQEKWMAAATASKEPATEPPRPRQPQPRTEAGHEHFTA